jgi:hypothetical protein
MSCAVVQGLFGGVEVVEGRDGRNGRLERPGTCPLSWTLAEARWAIRQERERREKEAAERAAFDAATKQLTIFGTAEVAQTLRNPFTDAREREDERKGLTAR